MKRRAEINSRGGINVNETRPIILSFSLSPCRSDLNFPRLDKRKYIYTHIHHISRRRPAGEKTKRKKAKSVLDHGYSSVTKWTCIRTCARAPPSDSPLVILPVSLRPLSLSSPSYVHLGRIINFKRESRGSETRHESKAGERREQARSDFI